MAVDPLILELPSSIETDRLIMRPWQQGDEKQLHELQQESWEQFNKWYGGVLAKEKTSKDDMKGYINGALSGWYDRSWIEFVTFEKESGKMIGTASLHHLDWSVPKGRIGYIVRNSAGGKGYATEMANVMTRLAFNFLDLKRLEIRASIENPASNKIPRKLGYQFLTVFEKNKASVNGDLWDLEIHVRFNSNNLPDVNVNWS
jgi:RimJ/RimL family protein N-acetyltransferase